MCLLSTEYIFWCASRCFPCLGVVLDSIYWHINNIPLNESKYSWMQILMNAPCTHFWVRKSDRAHGFTWSKSWLPSPIFLYRYLLSICTNSAHVECIHASDHQNNKALMCIVLLMSERHDSEEIHTQGDTVCHCHHVDILFLRINSKCNHLRDKPLFPLPNQSSTYVRFEDASKLWQKCPLWLETTAWIRQD